MMIQFTTPIKISSLFILLYLSYSCTGIEEKKDKNRLLESVPPIEQLKDTLFELSVTQETALEALNQIQLQAEGRLYSTFVGSVYPCYQPDSTFTISQKKFGVTLQELFSDRLSETQSSEFNQLIETAIKAQKEYKVERCFGHSGTWVIRNVLSRRDIILE